MKRLHFILITSIFYSLWWPYPFLLHFVLATETVASNCVVVIDCVFLYSVLLSRALWHIGVHIWQMLSNAWAEGWVKKPGEVAAIDDLDFKLCKHTCWWESLWEQMNRATMWPSSSLLCVQLKEAKSLSRRNMCIPSDHRNTTYNSQGMEIIWRVHP